MIPKGAKKISPGVYVHGEVMHVDAMELCLLMGLRPTREAQDVVANAALEVALQNGIQFEEGSA